MGIKNQTRRVIQNTEKLVYNRTYSGSFRLRQENKDGSRYVWSLNKTERNYEIHDKKMLAVIRGLEN